jgi:shikimate kinase
MEHGVKKKDKEVNMSIYLIGFMGSGKTYIGKEVAKKLGLPFQDIDEIVEAQSRKTIEQIFEKWGEYRFRLMETEILQNWHDDSVFATGGGIVISAVNREFLKNPENVIIWLNPSWDTIYKRIQKSTRPLLQDRSEADLKKLWESRAALYQECAKHIIKEEKPERVIDEIVQICKKK